MSFDVKCVRETAVHTAALVQHNPLRLSLLAVVIAASCSNPARAAETTTSAATDNQTMLVSASEDSGVADTTKTDYSVPVTRAGTKLTSTLRDIPQSVSIISQQRMEDQQLQSLGQVLSNTTGIPTVFASRWNLGDAQSDTALYERIEVVRGATGLMTGPGNPSAAINMVRKHADSRDFTGNISASYGSWDKQRYVADLSAPLSASGNVRGRLVAGFQDNNSFIERYGAKKQFVYGVVDADLTDSTTLSVGYEFQKINADSPMWNGAPRWYTDGSQIHSRRGFNTAPDWTYNDKESKKIFVNLKQNFDNGWNITLNGTHNEMTMDSKMMYVSGYFDKNTGIGINEYPASSNYDAVGGTGYNTAKRKVDGLDAFSSGPYELFGRQHELMTGISYNRQENNYYSAFENISPDMLGNYNNYTGQFRETDWSPRTKSTDSNITRQKSAYLATRISLADPLHLILGARYTNWNRTTMTDEMEKNNITPYGGLMS